MDILAKVEISMDINQKEIRNIVTYFEEIEAEELLVHSEGIFFELGLEKTEGKTDYKLIDEIVSYLDSLNKEYYIKVDELVYLGTQYEKIVSENGVKESRRN